MKGWWLIFIPLLMIYAGSKHPVHQPKVDELGYPIETEKK